MLEQIVKWKTSLEIVNSIRDQLRTDYGDFLNKTQTTIDVGGVEDSNCYLVFRTTCKEIDLTVLQKDIPYDICYKLEYVDKFEPRSYSSPSMKSEPVEPVLVWILYGDQEKVRKFILDAALKVVEEEK
ncbi:hypothetical protein GOV03_03635 [Candidatus Woesearchaeota archaeon]|nr:hypothetical protein [Candidatus Woesearchaeota archaeon]